MSMTEGDLGTRLTSSQLETVIPKFALQTLQPLLFLLGMNILLALHMRDACV